MNRKIIESVIAAIAVTAITTSSKAIIDVNTLKETETIKKETLREIKTDIRIIRADIKSLLRIKPD